jgi:hypothetical protein
MVAIVAFSAGAWMIAAQPSETESPVTDRADFSSPDAHPPTYYPFPEAKVADFSELIDLIQKHQVPGVHTISLRSGGGIVVHERETVDEDRPEIRWVVHANGQLHVTRLTLEHLRQTPRWNADSENPPLSARTALENATNTIVNNIVPFDLNTTYRPPILKLQRFENHWFWVVYFSPDNFPMIFEPFPIVVLMDGTVLQSRRQSPGGLSPGGDGPIALTLAFRVVNFRFCFFGFLLHEFCRLGATGMSTERIAAAGAVRQLVACGDLQCRFVTRRPFRDAAGRLSQQKALERVPHAGEAQVAWRKVGQSGGGTEPPGCKPRSTSAVPSSPSTRFSRECSPCPA